MWNLIWSSLLQQFFFVKCLDCQLSHQLMHACWSKSQHSESWAKIFDWNAWNNNNLCWRQNSFVFVQLFLTKIFSDAHFFKSSDCLILWPYHLITLAIKYDHFGGSARKWLLSRSSAGFRMWDVLFPTTAGFQKSPNISNWLFWS